VELTGMWSQVLATIIGAGILAVCGGALTWMYASYQRFVGMENKLGTALGRMSDHDDQLAQHDQQLTKHDRHLVELRTAMRLREES
jgi:hypothetical protein